MIIPRSALTRHFGLIPGLVVTCAVLILFFLTAMHALADPGDLQSRQADADRVQAEISAINLSAEQAIERYNQANAEFEDTKKRIAENQTALDVATGNLVEAQERLNKRMKHIYRDGSLSIMDVIVNTTSFSEFMSRFDLLGRIGNQDKSDVETVLKYMEEVENARTRLEEDRQKQEDLVETLAAEKAEIESQLAARQAVLDSVEGDIAAIIAQQQQASAANQSPAGGGSSGPTPQASAGPPLIVPGPEPPTQAPPPSNGGAASIAMQYLGVPYVWGGASPSGFDCSGLVMYVYAQLGVYLPHSAAAQFYSGTPISSSDLAPGDLVFFGSPISHVGIYIGGGSMVHAPFEGAVVSVSSIWAGGSYSGASRI